MNNLSGLSKGIDVSSKQFATTSKGKSKVHSKRAGEKKVKKKYNYKKLNGSETDGSGSGTSQGQLAVNKHKHKSKKKNRPENSTASESDTDLLHKRSREKIQKPMKVKSVPVFSDSQTSDNETSHVDDIGGDLESRVHIKNVNSSKKAAVSSSKKVPRSVIKQQNPKAKSQVSAGHTSHTGEKIPLVYKILLVFLFLLVTSCIIGLVFVGIGDHIAKRYSWYDYEAKVDALIITFGLASASGIVFVILIIFTQLNALRRNRPNVSIFVMIIITAIFGLVSLICAIVQLSSLDGVFAVGFFQLFEEYFIHATDKMILDKVQIEFECCGLESFEDWNEYETSDERYVEGFVPFSCCDPKILRPCIHEKIYDSQFNYVAIDRNPSSTTIYMKGCLTSMQQYYKEFLDISISLSMIYLILELGVFVLVFLTYRAG